MFRLLVLLCAGLFLVLLIGGRDSGQTRLGLQGAYDIAVLKDDPPAAPEAVAEAAPVAPAPVEVSAVAEAARPAPAPAATPGLTEVSFAPAGEQPGAAAGGLTLSLPLVREPVAQAEAPAAPAPAPAEADAPRLSRILGSNVNVREAPSAKAAVLDRLARDETVTVISSDGSGWTLVRIEGDGIEGYVASRYLSEPETGSALFPSE